MVDEHISGRVPDPRVSVAVTSAVEEENVEHLVHQYEIPLAASQPGKERRIVLDLSSVRSRCRYLLVFNKRKAHYYIAVKRHFPEKVDLKLFHLKSDIHVFHLSFCYFKLSLRRRNRRADDRRRHTQARASSRNPLLTCSSRKTQLYRRRQKRRLRHGNGRTRNHESRAWKGEKDRW